MTFVDGLTLLFIALKLTGYIDWSWWYVFSPFIITFIVTVIVKVLYED